MNRDLLYPGQIALVDNTLDAFKAAMIGDAILAEAILGQTPPAYGFAATALSNTAVSGSPFAISLDRGVIFSYQQTDPNAYGVLGTDTATSILKSGVNLTATNIGIASAAPALSGQSINYVISAAFKEVDGNSTSIPFYNSASTPTDPLPPLIQTQNATRIQSVVFQVTGGAAATTGNQATPPTPAGYFPLYVVTVTNGQSAVDINGIRALGDSFITSLTQIAFQTNGSEVVFGSGWYYKKWRDSTSPSGYFIEQGVTGTLPASGNSTSTASVIFPVAFNTALPESVHANAMRGANSTYGSYPAFGVTSVSNTSANVVGDTLTGNSSFVVTFNQTVSFSLTIRGF